MKKSFVVFLICLFVFSAGGQSGGILPSRLSLQGVKKLFKSSKEKRQQCVDGTGGYFFVHDQEEAVSSPDEDILQQCATDLCGPPKIFMGSFSDSDIKRTIQPDLIKQWEDEFYALGVQETIEKWVDEEMKDSLHLQKILKKVVSPVNPDLIT